MKNQLGYPLLFFTSFCLISTLVTPLYIPSLSQSISVSNFSSPRPYIIASSRQNLTTPSNIPDAWPDLPSFYQLPDSDAYLVFTRTLSPVSADTIKQALVQRLLGDEIDFLTAYPRQFSRFGISVARIYTDTLLTCHQATVWSTWTFQIAIDMLRELQKILDQWGSRDFEFEVWKRQAIAMRCRLWIDFQ